ncbi:MAG: competence/damage-inducible protein A [Candidatus Tyrphobacter sp.]
MPCIEIVAVGTELLLGQQVDTNTPFIAAHLAGIGIDVYGTHCVGDNRQRIVSAISAALARADGVITTGGLGPTVDDLTREAVCDVLGVPCVRDARTIARMERFFAAIGRQMTENNRKQADMPSGSTILENANGTAPGLLAIRDDGRFVACVPGVPGEMKPMVTQHLIPLLQERLRASERIVTRTLHVIGLGESEIDARIGDLFAAGENPKIAVLAHGTSCDVKVMAKARGEGEARAMIETQEPLLRERLGGHVFGADEETLAGCVLALARERHWRIAVAESCTGGRIASLLTAVAGASDAFAGGVVAYENDAKSRLLAVDAGTIEAHGAVSEEAAAAMASGARDALAAEVGLATTGIAGPSGGTREKPVGLVWFAIQSPSTSMTRGVRLSGSRDEIQMKAAEVALTLLWGILLDRRRSDR